MKKLVFGLIVLGFAAHAWALSRGLPPNGHPSEREAQITSRLDDLWVRDRTMYMTLRITVPSASFDEMVAGGGYVIKNEVVTEEHFPLGTSPPVVDMVLLNFDHDVDGIEALHTMKRMHLRPASMREFLALGMVRREFGIDFPVIAPGVWWRNEEGVVYAPHIASFGAGEKRGSVLNVGTIKLLRPTVCWFAAVLGE